MKPDSDSERGSLVEALERAALAGGADGLGEHPSSEQVEQHARDRRRIRARARAVLLLESKKRVARLAAGMCAVLFLVEAAGSLWLVNADRSGVGIAAVNSAVKAVVFCALCGLASYDLRQFRRLLALVIAGELLVVAGLLATLALGVRMVPEHMALGDAATTTAFVWAGASLAVAAALSWVRSIAYRGDFGLGYLSVLEFKTLRAIAEVAVDTVLLDPDDLARNIDEYFASFQSSRKREARAAVVIVALRPLLARKPPLASVDPAERLLLFEDWQVGRGSKRRTGRLTWAVTVALDLAYLGFYGDERSYPFVGYQPPTLSVEQRVASISPRHLPAAEIEADVAIVGTGGAASVIAHELTREGRGVLMVERGRDVATDETGTDELARRATLLADGGLAQILDPALPVLAASAVGGNLNASSGILIAPPRTALADWKLRGIWEDGALDRAASRVTDLLGASPVAPGARGPLEWGLGDFRIGDGARVSMRSGTAQRGSPLLWRVQEEFGDRLAIIGECSAHRIVRSGTRATGIECKLRDGRELVIRATTVIVAAGAPGSSLLLRKSGIKRRVGECMSLYAGCRIVAEFPSRVEARTPTAWAFDDFVIRADKLTPADQSLLLALPVEEHLQTMLRLPHLAGASALVGTSPGSLRLAPARPWGPKLEFAPGATDLRRLAHALVLTGDILNRAGGKRVIGPGEDLGATPRLSTAYPLGGNALGLDQDDSVVGPDFRVHGHDNLFVCDASVVPSSLSVEPELTVMALAYLAAQSIK